MNCVIIGSGIGLSPIRHQEMALPEPILTCCQLLVNTQEKSSVILNQHTMIFLQENSYEFVHVNSFVKCWPFHLNLYVLICYSYRDQSRYVPSLWETSLHCNDVSHWLGAYLDWSLQLLYMIFMQMISCCLGSGGSLNNNHMITHLSNMTLYFF